MFLLEKIFSFSLYRVRYRQVLCRFSKACGFTIYFLLKIYATPDKVSVFISSTYTLRLFPLILPEFPDEIPPSFYLLLSIYFFLRIFLGHRPQRYRVISSVPFLAFSLSLSLTREYDTLLPYSLVVGISSGLLHGYCVR